MKAMLRRVEMESTLPLLGRDAFSTQGLNKTGAALTPAHCVLSLLKRGAATWPSGFGGLRELAGFDEDIHLIFPRRVHVGAVLHPLPSPTLHLLSWSLSLVVGSV